MTLLPTKFLVPMMDLHHPEEGVLNNKELELNLFQPGIPSHEFVIKAIADP